jgi:hypothetical protein
MILMVESNFSMKSSGLKMKYLIFLK